MPLCMNREAFITCAVTGSGGTQDGNIAERHASTGRRPTHLLRFPRGLPPRRPQHASRPV